MRLLGKVIDPLVFSQSGHVALVIALALLLFTGSGAFAWALLGLSVVHHVLSYTVLRRLYLLSVPDSRHVGWFPLANLVMDWVLLRAIRMCLTGRVTWRGTAYGPHVVEARTISRAEQAETANRVDREEPRSIVRDQVSLVE